MSRETLNELIGLAMISPDFCERLLAHPQQAAHDYGFQLTPEEQKAFGEIRADTIHEFSKQIMEKLMPDG